MDKLKIVWTDQAKTALKSIFDYYKEKSPQGAKNVKSDILKSTKQVLFAQQYQVDEINSNYRRIVVRIIKYCTRRTMVSFRLWML